jgi:hypothetical protein
VRHRLAVSVAGKAKEPRVCDDSNLLIQGGGGRKKQAGGVRRCSSTRRAHRRWWSEAGQRRTGRRHSPVPYLLISFSFHRLRSVYQKYRPIYRDFVRFEKS